MTTYSNFKSLPFSCADVTERGDSYFAALNTSSGFINNFDEIFASAKKTIILKGGPGTGKSTLIRAVASEAKNRDMAVEYFYCSSDTNSLDGVLIGNGEIAVIDGTSPHSVDPKIPGAKDEIVNLGEFWNSCVLKDSSHEIKYYLDAISSLYKNIYDAMAIAASAEKLIEKLVLRHTDLNKMNLAAERIARLFSTDRLQVRRRGISAFGVHGYVLLDSYEKRADDIYTFRDKYSLSHIFLDMLKEKFETKLVGFDYSRSPIFNQTDALLLRGENVAFLPIANDPSRIINTERFISKSIATEKEEIKQLRVISSTAIKIAEKKLSCIGELHDELEEIYIGAMDFKGLGAFTKRLLISIFKNQHC